MLGQKCFQRSDDRALPLNVNRARTFERDALRQQLRSVPLRQRCVHARKVSRSRSVGPDQAAWRSTAFFVSLIARIRYASPPSTHVQRMR